MSQSVESRKELRTKIYGPPSAVIVKIVAKRLTQAGLSVAVSSVGETPHVTIVHSGIRVVTFDTQLQKDGETVAWEVGLLGYWSASGKWKEKRESFLEPQHATVKSVLTAMIELYVTELDDLCKAKAFQ